MSNQPSKSNALASNAENKQEMPPDTETPIPGDERPIVIPARQEINLITGIPDLDACPDGYARCPICKVDKLTTQNQDGNNDNEVPDVLKQLEGQPPIPSTRHKDFQHCLPPTQPVWDNKFALFTAGSIEMGSAVQWQRLLAKHLQDLPITVCNPRRGTWDKKIQPKKGDPDFFAQVNWELNCLEKVDVIVFFFDCNTSSPISLLELGLWAASGKVIVCCDQRFWKQANVDMVCERYNIPYVFSFHHLLPAVREFMELKGLKKDQEGDFAKFPKKEAPPSSRPIDHNGRWWEKHQDTAAEAEFKKTKADYAQEAARKAEAKRLEDPKAKAEHDGLIAQLKKENVENALMEGRR